MSDARMLMEAALARGRLAYKAAMYHAEVATQAALRAEESRVEAEDYADLAIQYAKEAAKCL